jgi:hypothetical protein
MGMDARTNAKRHPDYLPGCDFRTSKFMLLLSVLSVKMRRVVGHINGFIQTWRAVNHNEDENQLTQSRLCCPRGVPVTAAGRSG